MTEMKRELFFEILDAFDFEISNFEKRKGLCTGSAINTASKEERYRHLAEAKQYGDWAKEAMRTKETFLELYKPSEE